MIDQMSERGGSRVDDDDDDDDLSVKIRTVKSRDDSAVESCSSHYIFCQVGQQVDGETSSGRAILLNENQGHVNTHNPSLS